MAQTDLTTKRTKKQDGRISRYEGMLEEMRNKVEAINYWRDDGESLKMLGMTLERYGKIKSEWFLHPDLNETGFIMIRGMRFNLNTEPPSIREYKTVSYWEAYANNSKEEFNEAKEESEVEEFVKDRLDWAELQYLDMIEIVEERLEEEKEKEMW